MKLTRRNLLAASLFTPFMRAAWADTGTPARVVIVVEGNSFYPSNVMSAVTRTALGKPAHAPGESTFSTGYGAGTPLLVDDSQLGAASALTPLRTAGLEGKSAVVLGLSSQVTGGGHSTGRGALTCSRGGAGASIDTVLGAKMKKTTPFDVLRVGVETGEARLSYSTCSLGPNRAAPILLNTDDVYQRLFGIITAGSGNASVARNARLLDFARGDVRDAMGAFGGSTQERAKLEAYVSALENMQARASQLEGMRGQVLPHVPTAPMATSDLLVRMTSHVDMVAAALLGGLTNVAVIVSGPGGGLSNRYDSVFTSLRDSGEVSSWPDDELSMNRHTLQHGIGVARNRIGINAVTRRHVELIARLASKLDAVPEGNGTVLDHTAILFISDNGEQHHSTGAEWPAVLVGGKSLGLKTDGRTVVYPSLNRAGNRQVSNLFNTLGHASGDTTMNAFGHETNRVAEGPLSELF